MAQELSYPEYRKQLQEHCFDYGMDEFSPVNALELALSYAGGADVRPVAQKLLETFGTFSGVVDSDEMTLRAVEGVSENAACLLTMMPQLARIIATNWWLSQSGAFLSPSRTGSFFCDLLLGENNEKLYLLCLDRRGRYISHVLMHEGTLSEVSFYPRDFAIQALNHNACYIVIAHNHPGCNTQPSPADISATGTLCRALNAIDVIVLDHIIVGGGGYSSMNGSGILYEQPAANDDRVFRSYSEAFCPDGASDFARGPLDILAWEASRQYGLSDGEPEPVPLKAKKKGK